jgi:photosystem II stability/assembly factor-like uncharacterized protein
LKLYCICAGAITLFLQTQICFGQDVWQRLPNAPMAGENQRFDDVFFIDPSNGWIVHVGESKIYKTSDGGNSDFARAQNAWPPPTGQIQWNQEISIERSGANVTYTRTREGKIWTHAVQGEELVDVIVEFLGVPIFVLQKHRSSAVSKLESAQCSLPDFLPICPAFTQD